MAGYDFAAIEKKWQQHWHDNETFRQPNPGEDGFEGKPKLYILDMFPYPSGAGLHVGHPEGYTATDIVARYSRMKGYNVLHPMGYDSFGLPAQQYAVEHGVHPRETTAANIANIERQIKMFGFSYDWSRRVATTDVEYYRWTQWIFLEMYNSWYDPESDAARPIGELVHRLESGDYVVDPVGQATASIYDGMGAYFGVPVGTSKWHELPPERRREIIDDHRLAYMAEVPVNWCPKLGTVLANEEVTNEGRSDRGDHPVYRRALRQWMLRITAYTDRLLDDLEMLDWPESIKIMQRNWIGRSTGAEVDFPLCSGTGLQPVSVYNGSTGLQPVAELRRIAALPKQDRPSLAAKTFEGCDPFPNTDPSPPDLMKTIRNLPHVTLPGATYFVSWCCKKTQLAPEERNSVLEPMLHWHNERCVVYAACVLDDHAHMLLRPIGDHALSDILRGIKRHSARHINQKRNTGGSIWQDESFDHIVRDFEWFTRFVYYICDNPVERELTERFDDYPWLFVNSEEVASEDGERFGHTLGDAFGHRLQTCATREEEQVIRVYTTRPDTLFGATYMVLAPEHPLVAEITTSQQRDAVNAYVAQAARKSELERIAETKDKTGVFTGACAINPVSRQRIQIWVADYVMMGYGTGAIMAVPAHDTRDLEFAETFGLPVIQVVQPPDGIDWRGYVGDGVGVNSGPYDGLPTDAFKKAITKDLHKTGLGREAVNYRLRDWIFSRQWYWGEPFPIIHCDDCGTVGVPPDQLPVLLPEMDDYQPEISDDPNAPPRPPLGKLTDWVNTACPQCGGPAKRELNTMPQWAGSCWYYLRYLDPKNEQALCDPDLERYWMGSRDDGPGGVDLYVGGAEHAVLHLLYARFWHKVLYDLGHVSSPEPFAKLFNQGMIRSLAYRDQRGVCVGYDDVDLSGDAPRHKQTGGPLTETVEKMSKSLKNVVNPDEVIAEHGADTFRLYEMFMGPLEASKPWNTRDVPGVGRFLQRCWRMIVGDEDRDALLAGATGDEAIDRALHRLIKKVGEDIEAMKFNTAIAAMMEFVNAVFKAERISEDQARSFVLVLAPFAPHLAEELWQRLGGTESLAHEPFPTCDESLIVEQTVELAVQVNGKVRAKIQVAADATDDECLAAALAEKKIAAALEGKTVVKQFVVAGRLVNLVVK